MRTQLVVATSRKKNINGGDSNVHQRGDKDNRYDDSNDDTRNVKSSHDNTTSGTASIQNHSHNPKDNNIRNNNNNSNIDGSSIGSKNSSTGNNSNIVYHRLPHNSNYDLVDQLPNTVSVCFENIKSYELIALLSDKVRICIMNVIYIILNMPLLHIIIYIIITITLIININVTNVSILIYFITIHCH